MIKNLQILFSLILFTSPLLAQVDIINENFNDPKLRAYVSPAGMLVWGKGHDFDYRTDSLFNGSQYLNFRNWSSGNAAAIVTDSVDLKMYDSLVVNFDYYASAPMNYFISEENKLDPYGTHFHLSDSANPAVLNKGKVIAGTGKVTKVIYPSKGVFRIELIFIENPGGSVLKIDNYMVTGISPVVTDIYQNKFASDYQIESYYLLTGEKVDMPVSGEVYILKYKNGEAKKVYWSGE